MRKFFNRLLFGTIILFSGMVSSCTNELPYPEPNPNDSVQIQLVKTPDVIAYSGGQVLGSTFGTKGVNLPAMYSNVGNGDYGNTLWPSFGANSLENIEDDEREGVLAEIDKKATGERISEDIVFYYENYFLQDIISGVNSTFPNAGANNTSSSSYTMEAWSKGEVCDPQGDYSDWNKHGYYITGTWNNETDTPYINPDYSNENYTEVTNSGHITNMFVHNSQTQIKETALMTDMKLGTYEEMKGKQFRWFINCHENLHWSEYIVVKYNNNYYICFDFACGHEENKNIDGHTGKGCETNDWDYNDWVLKITLAGEGEILGETEVIEPTPDTPNIPSVVPKHNNEVEVNYAILDEHPTIGDLVTKLSIHVRKGTNVRITIPIPESYVCESDDFNILQKHEEGYGVWTGTDDNTELVIDREHSIQYDFGEYGIVTLTVTVGVDVITVQTDGITQDLIDHLFEQNGDGINFEIWNYFDTNSETNFNRDDLIKFMNQSTIEFLDEEPDYYINAFGCNSPAHWGDESERGEHNCVKHEYHATVIPNSNYKLDSPQREHLNQTRFNDIYNRNDVNEEH